MNPVNYAAMFVNPADQAMQGYATGLNMQGAQQALRMNDAAEARARELHPLAVAGARQDMDLAAQANDRANTTLGMRQQAQAAALQQQQAQAARQQQFSADMGALAQLGPGATFQDYAETAARYPEFAESINESWSALDDNRKSGMSEIMGQAAVAFRTDNPDRAISLLNQYADAAENSGDAASAATARALADTAKINPDAALASLGMTLSTVNPDLAQDIMGGNAGVQSTQMIGGRVSVQTMSDGNTRVVDATTNEVLTGQDAQDAIAEAESSVAELERDKNFNRASGMNEAEIESGGQAKAAEALGSAQATFVTDALSSAGTVRSNLRNINEAIQAIDDGAEAGLIYNRMPRITEAGATLQNAMDRMGLDVIGSVTFGALSEGELRLAMSTAVPRGLAAPELRNWLVQRRDAQEKVLQAMTEQAEFLSNPENTLNDWIEQVGSDSAPTPSVEVGSRSYMDLLND